MKCWNSAFNAQGSKVIIVGIQVGAIKNICSSSGGAQKKWKARWNLVYHRNWWFSKFPLTKEKKCDLMMLPNSYILSKIGADMTIFPSSVYYAGACPTSDMQIFEASTVFSLRISPGILDQIV